MVDAFASLDEIRALLSRALMIADELGETYLAAQIDGALHSMTGPLPDRPSPRDDL